MATYKPRDQSSEEHGIGKGLMAIPRLINLASTNLPTCVDNEHGACSQFPPFISQKPPIQLKKKSIKHVMRRLVNKLQ